MVMLHLNDIQSWHYPDPRPGEALSEVFPISARARSLLARSNSPVVREHFAQLVGVPSMLSGMEYHHHNYCALVQLLGSEDQSYEDNLRHEAVAWLNRVSQFNSFATSTVAKNVQAATPVISSVLPFRHKHGAHRSIDKPFPSDSEKVQIAQAISMSELGGLTSTRRLPWPSEDASDSEFAITPANHFLGFSMPTEKDLRDLFIERDHPEVMLEAYALLKALLT